MQALWQTPANLVSSHLARASQAVCVGSDCQKLFTWGEELEITEATMGMYILCTNLLHCPVYLLWCLCSVLPTI